MSDWNFINKNRCRSGHFASDDSYGFNGAFSFAFPGEARRVFCIASDGESWQHVSVSFGPNRSTPSWEIMCRVKDLFWEPEDVVMQLHPRSSEYINDHNGVLHLWKPIGETPKIPEPPSILVGVKNKYVSINS